MIDNIQEKMRTLTGLEPVLQNFMETRKGYPLCVAIAGYENVNENWDNSKESRKTHLWLECRLSFNTYLNCRNHGDHLCC